MDNSQLLDKLEDIIIKAVLPYIKIMKQSIKLDMDEREIAINIIKKIGTRMMFGKEVCDRVYFKK